MDFSKIRALTIPEGSVDRIKDEDGAVLWAKKYVYRYVSIGDSIAAGHTINDRWEVDYGEGSQYGKNGNSMTAIVPGCYTDLIRERLITDYGRRIETKSFARSGDTVADLLEKLSHETVQAAIRMADLITICIGANDVLQPALSHLDEYITAGDSALAEMSAEIEKNLAKLADDSDPVSYKALFDRLTELNDHAEIVFTTIYNPYKYLWIEEGTDGFFEPLLDTIPDMTILGFDIDGMIRESLLDTDIVQTLFERTNALPAWAENHVTQLNAILASKIGGHKNKNIKLAETKALFEVFPDRPVSAEKHYNDLVSVEYTRGYDTAKMDWGRLWEGSSAAAFWLDIVTDYVSLSGFDIDGLANELIALMIEKVIVPDVDPHPEEYGHYVMMRSFADVLGWISLDRHTITYYSNDSNGAVKTQEVAGIDGIAAFTYLAANSFSAAAEGYYMAHWSTSATGGGASYSDGQYAGINSDLDLYAQWSNIYKIDYRHTNKTNLYTDDETGHMECYALYINEELMPKLGKFSDGNNPIYYLPYGTAVRVVVSNYNPTEITYDDINCDVYWNGVSVSKGYRGTEYSFALTSNIIVDFQWRIAGSLATFNAQSWEDCYITTT